MFQNAPTATSGIVSRIRFGATVAASRASGIAMNLSRSTLAPRSLGTMNATTSAARKDGEQAEQPPCAGHARRDGDPEEPKRDTGNEVGDAERELSLLREDSPERELQSDCSGYHRNCGSARSRAEGAAREYEDEQQQREWACEQRQEEQDREAASVPSLQRRDREQREHRAERERECGRKDDARPENRERSAREARRRPPLLPDDERERQRRDADRQEREQTDPEHGRERVVDEAVGDERVPAGVPKVVPDRETVLEQERALVVVSCEIDAGRPEPDKHACEPGRHDGGEKPLAGEQPNVLRRSHARAYC